LRCAANAADLIKEDHVRILRAVRFEAQLGFRIDDSLLRVIKGLKNEFYWQDYEKVCNELTQILLSDRPSASIRRMLDLVCWSTLFPSDTYRWF
jgi:tRNA nucleotidyltransferase/poly(A) polymerase